VQASDQEELRGYLGLFMSQLDTFLPLATSRSVLNGTSQSFGLLSTAGEECQLQSDLMSLSR